MNRPRPTSRRRCGGGRDRPADRDRAPAESSSPVEPHLPKIGFEAGARSKVDGERSKPPLPASPRERFVERALGLTGEPLVLKAGVHVEPFAIGVAVAA